jgi:transcriptional regulator with GAF, ATPase, and Fis domain
LAVARALASASATDQAARDVLQALAGAMDWECGAVWLLDDEAAALRCVGFWSEDEPATTEFRRETKRLSFERGVGLPGRAWERGEPVWLHDVATEKNFPRVNAAAQAGLHGAVAMPIMAGASFVGVLEFFSGSLQVPDDAVETILESVGDQFVQFFRRKRAEDELAAARSELESQQFARQQSADINDNIIHWLVQITQALDAGDQRGAQRATHEALQHASRIITDLQALPRASGG